MKRTVLAAALLIMGIMQADAYATCADHNFTYIVRCQRDEIEGEQNVNWAGYHKCIVFEKYWSWSLNACGSGWNYAYCRKSGESMQGNFVAGSPACEDRCENIGNASFELIKEICIGPGDDIADPLAGGNDWYCPITEDKDEDGHFAYLDSSLLCPPSDDCNDDPDKGGREANPAKAEVCDDQIDNDCDGLTDAEDVEDCGLVMSYVSGNKQTDYICETLGQPLTVLLEGGARANEAVVEWLITNSPSGSNASFSGDVVVEEAERVLHKEYLNLGAIPGEFTIEARCEDCNDGSPQFFTENAICKEVPPYSQTAYPNDPYDNWCKTVDAEGNKTGSATCADDGDIEDGYIQYSIAEKGCALTSAVMVMNWYGYGSSGALDPLSLDELMIGVPDGYIEGDFNFGKLKNLTDPDLLVYTRNLNKGESTVTKSELDGWLEMCIPVIVGVNNKAHWVVVTEKLGSDYVIKDPGYSKTLLSQYGNIYAYRALYNAKGVCAK